MGKKKNKKNNNRDIFNPTYEEQMANADLFYAMEKGEITMLDFLGHKIKERNDYTEQDYSDQLEAAYRRQEKDRAAHALSNTRPDEREAYNTPRENEDVESYRNSVSETAEEPVIEEYSYDSNGEDSETETMEETTMEVYSYDSNGDDEYEEEIVDDNSTIAKVHFGYEPVTSRLLIDDGLISTPVSVICTTSIGLKEEHIPDDSDVYAKLLSKLFYYIIACKHPAVIMSIETFELEFSLFSRINFNKFVFFKNEGLVYAYVIDENEVDNFYAPTNIFKMDNNAILSYVIGVASAASSLHNAFMYDDEDEVDSVMNARNDVKGLIAMIEQDSKTEYAGHNASGDVLSRMQVTDLVTFIDEVRVEMDELTDVYDDEVDIDDIDDDDDDDIDDEESDDEDETEDDDDASDDDNDDDDDDIDVTDYPDIDSSDIEDYGDIDSLMESMQSLQENSKGSKTVVETITKSTVTIDKTNDDNMVLPIIHRR